MQVERNCLLSLETKKSVGVITPLHLWWQNGVKGRFSLLTSLVQPFGYSIWNLYTSCGRFITEGMWFSNGLILSFATFWLNLLQGVEISCVQWANPFEVNTPPMECLYQWWRHKKLFLHFSILNNMCRWSMIKNIHSQNLVGIGSWGPEIWPHEYLISPIEISVNWPGSKQLWTRPIYTDFNGAN